MTPGPEQDGGTGREVLRLAVLGARGRMGSRVCALADETPGIDVVAVVTGTAAVPAAGELPPVPARTAFDRAHVVVDFSIAAAVPHHAALAARHRRPLVCGVTGLDAGQERALHEASAHAPVVVAPNTSLLVTLLARLARSAARVLGPDFDAGIIDLHHRHKRDAPSGTALRLGRAVAEGRAAGGGQGREVDYAPLRAGDIVSEHTVLFAGPGERLELTHRCQDRTVLARGALRAALWVRGRPPGLYGMEDVLGTGEPAPGGARPS